MTFVIKKAERKAKKLKMALHGISGSGKTWTALEIAKGLGQKILLVDTENSSAELYADHFDFDHVNITDFSVKNYVAAISEAVTLKYDVLIIDSLSQSWESLLELVDDITNASKSKNSFTAWGKVTPIYKELVQEIVQANIHIICTMRAKSDYIMVEKNGKTVPEKVGLAPIFRQGGEYEFDVVANLDIDHTMSIEKTRISIIADKFYKKPTYKLGEELANWLNSGKKATYKISFEAIEANPRKDKFIEYLEKLTYQQNGDHYLVTSFVELPALAAYQI